MTPRILPLLLGLSLLFSCSPPATKDSGRSTEADADTDSDSDSDSDSDADSDSDSDADSDADSDYPDTADTGEDVDDPEDSSDSEDSESDTAKEDCDTETDVVLFLSPDDSNSMASPVLARGAVLDDWGSLNSVPIRTWEFFNYYSFDYTPPSTGDIALTAALRADDTEEGLYTLQIGVTSATLAPEDRPPLNLVYSLDNSGSMSGEPIELLKNIANGVAHGLMEGDVVSIVTWNDSHAILLDGHAVDGPDDPVLLEAIEGISAGGSTDLHSGLVTAYDLADENWIDGGINRVMLISDGGANTGETDERLIGDAAGAEDEDGIYLVGVGVGTTATYNPVLMDTVTDLGRGASLFIGSEAEAEIMFYDRFLEVMGIAVRDVQVELDLPPGFEIVRFSGEEYSTDPSEIEPQHLAPNDSMVFYQTLETCDPLGVLAESPITITARYTDATTFLGNELRLESTFEELLSEDLTMLAKGEAIFTLASALKAWKEGDEAWEIARDQAEVALSVALAMLPEDEDLLELEEMLEAL